MKNYDETRTVEVVFTRIGSFRSVCTEESFKGIKFQEFDVIHPTRITPEEWNQIMSARAEEVQQILSNFLRV